MVSLLKSTTKSDNRTLTKRRLMKAIGGGILGGALVWLVFDVQPVWMSWLIAGLFVVSFVAFTNVVKAYRK
jgi:uncharacterized membrane protein YccC